MVESIIYYGVPCDFGDHVRNRLLNSGYSIVAQVVPGRGRSTEPLREITPGTEPCGNALAESMGPERWFELDNGDPELAIRTLSELRPDVSVVCCYPNRLPIDLVNVARHDGLNVHPSLLPAYRGPVPLFWVYRNGEDRSGVTVHRVASGLDTGDILRQETLDIPIGAPGNEIWQQSARLGADLLLEALNDLASGAFHQVSQDASRSSYYARPESRDLLVDPTRWEAWRVYHFCRGVRPFGYTPHLVQGKILRPIVAAEGYIGELESSVRPQTGYEWITCSSGRVQLKLGSVVL